MERDFILFVCLITCLRKSTFETGQEWCFLITLTFL